MSTQLLLSVIVPVYNGGRDFLRCLQNLTSSIRPPDELIVVDDSSSDSSADLASNFGAHVLVIKDGPKGPAASRNHGAAIAHGDVLIFIDADVAVLPNTLARIENYFLENPGITALFGSYDDAPPQPGLVSQYKNLQHHYVHQHSQHQASTFWAGCGAVRREVFLTLGGFDERYKRPSIEDIEFGLRLHNGGYCVCLCPDIQATHLKRWNLRSLLRSDIIDRAIPWSRLIFSSAHLPSDLNLDIKSRLSVLAVWVVLILLALGFWMYWLWIGSVLWSTALFLLNLNLYRFFYRKGGLRFTVGSIGLHSLYYIYSSAAFVVVMAWHFLESFSKKLGLSTIRHGHFVEDPQHER